MVNQLHMTLNGLKLLCSERRNAFNFCVILTPLPASLFRLAVVKKCFDELSTKTTVWHSLWNLYSWNPDNSLKKSPVPDMKKSTAKFITKLFASVPVFTFFRKEPTNKNQRLTTVHSGSSEEQHNLNRIFMVRHRIQHL